jgi:isoquinoline 1-oxidoreductase alpha subunit
MTQPFPPEFLQAGPRAGALADSTVSRGEADSSPDGEPANTADAQLLSLDVNGVTGDVTLAPDTPLLWALRQGMGMPGTRFGCGMALCGACTVHINGEAVRSCVTPVSAAVGKKVTTIEGLTGPIGDALRTAWMSLDVAQCGYCQSGQIMSAAALLAVTPRPTDSDIDRAMDGNVCRCGTYPRIRAAIKAAGAQLSASRSGA